MTKEKREAVTIYIMLVSVLKMIEKPNKTVSKGTRTMYNGLVRNFLKAKKNTSIREADPMYYEINTTVMDAWDKARQELVDKAKPMQSSLSEMIQVLWDRMNKNPYQKLYISDKRMIAIINSIRDCPTNEDIEYEKVLEADNNARKLANRFLELCKIKKQHNLATRLAIQKQNLIIEGKI